MVELPEVNFAEVCRHNCPIWTSDALRRMSILVCGSASHEITGFSTNIMSRSVLTNASAFLHRTSHTPPTPLRCYQRRWAQVHDVRFVASHRRPADVQEKYKEKLDRMAREKGLRDAAELREAYSDKIREHRKQAIVPGANAPLNAQPPPPPHQTDASIPYQTPPPPQAQATANITKVPKNKDGVKTLGSFIDVEKTAVLPQKEIEVLWRLRHAQDPNSLCAAMQSSTFNRLAETARKHPQFILPLPREGQGAEIHFLQWTFPSPTTATVLFTHLAEFKARGEYAQPHTTVTYHLDMADDKGLVLLEGRVMEDRGMKTEEGQWLLVCLQKFYGFEAHSDAAKENKQRRQKLMEQFSGGDESFRVEELLEEAEKVP